MTYRIRVNRPATARFGSTSWDLLNSHYRPMEFAAPVEPSDLVRVIVETNRFPGEHLTFECYEVEA